MFAQSNASVIQQLAAGSYNIAPSAGMVDPIRAIDKGAPVALVRIVIQAPPYALLAKPAIKKIEDLKGKTIIIGGAKDITRIFTERMLAPHGLKSGDYDYVYRRRHQRALLGAEIRRRRCGAADLAVQFFRRRAGYTQSRLYLRLSARHAVRRHGGEPRLGAANTPICVKRFLDAYNKGVAWFDDPANREAAVKVQMATSKIKADDVEKAYTFLHDKKLFEPTGKVSKESVNSVIDALRGLGDVGADFTVDRVILPGVTQVSD